MATAAVRTVLGTTSSNADRRLTVLQDGEDIAFELILDFFRGLSRVDDIEVELRGHLVEFFDEQGLVLLKAVIEIRSQPKIHPRFPIVHPRRLDDSEREGFDIDPEIAHQVRNRGEPEDITDPRAIRASYEIACESGVDVAISQDDESGSESGNDLVLKSVGKIGRIEQAE